MENLVVNEPIKQNLLSAMKWLNFLTIFLTVMVALIGLAGIAFLFMPANDKFPGFIVGIVYIVMALVYVYPINKCFEIIRNVRNAINASLQSSLEDATADFYAVMKYYGIMAIVAVAFYVLLIIFGIAAFVFANLL